MEKKHILIVCGEPSGDLHAANLVEQIKKLEPRIKISGVGGEFMRQTGANLYCGIENLSAIGLFDALGKLPRFIALKKLILNKIGQDKPAAVILVDFSGFNLRLAKAINRRLPIIYYISPQVWASRPGRLKTIKKYVSKMIVFFKFEKELFNKHGIDVDFVGHPLLDIVKPTLEKEEFIKKFHIYCSRPTIALLPGSRKEEIERMLPLMLKAASIILKESSTAQFLIVKSPQVGWEVFHPITHPFKINMKVIEGQPYDCLNIADFCIVASGTATLETAIMQKPLLIIYKTSLLNYLLYRPLVRIPYIGIVNIIARKKIIPELIQFRVTPDKIAKATMEIISNQTYLQQIRNELASVKSSLGEEGAVSRAAKIIISLLNR